MKGFFHGLLNKAGFDATGASLYFYGLTVFDALDALKVGIPAFFALIVSVADVVTDKRFLAADIAYF